MNEKSRVIRVFLSSTFRDFGEERDLLVKKVFPELRRLCRQRQVELVDVDLRWGITAEEAEQGKVLPICLAEIDRARPYFMGFIGERYGWVPEESEYPEVVVEREPWLKEHQGGKSVTELEMLHGVLNNPEMAGRAFFYFRDKDYSLSKGGDYEPESPEHAVKLEKLRARLRESQFPVVENYPDPEALAERVREDLLKVIEEEYPEEDVPDAMALERMRHDAYGAARRKFYLGGDDEYFRALDDAVKRDGEHSRPVLVTGGAGVGKSALLANWVERYATSYPDTKILVHHISASSDAADAGKMVSRLINMAHTFMGDKAPAEVVIREKIGAVLNTLTENERRVMELKYGLIDGIPRTANQVSRTLEIAENLVLRAEAKTLRKLRHASRASDIKTLSKVTAGRPERFSALINILSAYAKKENKGILIVLDGLDKLTSHGELNWFPSKVPEGVKLVVSFAKEETAGCLRARDVVAKYQKKLVLEWEELDVGPFSEARSCEFIGSYLGRFRKTLTADLVDRVMTHPLANNPLWLLTLLEELRLFGKHEEVEERLETLLSDPPCKAEGEEPHIDDLFEHVLARIEEDIDQDYEVEALKALWASCDGLTRDELLDFTGMPPVKWSEIQVALDENLFESSGQIIFGNSFIRKAVEDRHLPNVADKQAAHRRLGEWFEGRELNRDVARERLHQWQQSGDREKLRMSLLDPELLRVLRYDQACEFLLAVGEDPKDFYNEDFLNGLGEHPWNEGLAKLIARVQEGGGCE